jgi:hypothetical protein
MDRFGRVVRFAGPGGVTVGCTYAHSNRKHHQAPSILVRTLYQRFWVPNVNLCQYHPARGITAVTNTPRNTFNNIHCGEHDRRRGVLA